jgi:hypothetical protein
MLVPYNPPQKFTDSKLRKYNKRKTGIKKPFKTAPF